MCQNKVTQYVPSGYGTKAIEMTCGNTDIHGGTLLCEAPPGRGPHQCDNKSAEGRPWYICKHGRDVSEYDCGLCEFD